MRLIGLTSSFVVLTSLFLVSAQVAAKEGAKHAPHWTHKNQVVGWSSHTGVQSPIALANPPAKPAGLPISYGEKFALGVRNTGHGWQVDYVRTVEEKHPETGAVTKKTKGEPGGTLTFQDASGKTRKFNLLQFHFHTQSEHTVAGVKVEGFDANYYPMELHFVHKDETMMDQDLSTSASSLAVIGVFITLGEQDNPALQALWDAGQRPLRFDATRLIPRNSGYWTYKGSLTTPPNTEGVTWIVFKEPIKASKRQIDAFVTAMKKEAGSGIFPNLVNRKIQKQIAGHELRTSDVLGK